MRRPRAAALTLAVACLTALAGGCASSGDGTPRHATNAGGGPATTPFDPPGGAASSDDGTRLLAAVAGRLERAGFRVERLVQRTGGRSTGLAIGDVHVWAYADAADARAEYRLFRSGTATLPAGHAFGRLIGNRVYDVALTRPMTPRERSTFERIVRVGEGG